MTKRWEYKTERIQRAVVYTQEEIDKIVAETEQFLNKMGIYGWELIEMKTAVAGEKEFVWTLWKREY